MLCIPRMQLMQCFFFCPSRAPVDSQSGTINSLSRFCQIYIEIFFDHHFSKLKVFLENRLISHFVLIFCYED